MKTTESVNEYLARGGKITKVPYRQDSVKKDHQGYTAPIGHASIMSLDGADLYYGEVRHKKSRPNKVKKPSIDVSALPSELISLILEQYAEKEDET